MDKHQFTDLDPDFLQIILFVKRASQIYRKSSLCLSSPKKISQFWLDLIVKPPFQPQCDDFFKC